MRLRWRRQTERQRWRQMAVKENAMLPMSGTPTHTEGLKRRKGENDLWSSSRRPFNLTPASPPLPLPSALMADGRDQSYSTAQAPERT